MENIIGKEPTLTLETAITSDNNAEAITYAKLKKIQKEPINFGDLLSIIDSNTITLNDRKEIANIFDMDSKDVNIAIKGYVKNNSLRDALGEVPKDEYEYVDLILNKWNTTMTFEGMFTINTPYDIGNGVIVHKSDLEELSAEDRIKIELNDPKTFPLKRMLMKLLYQNKKLKLNFPERDIGNALDLWMQNKRDDVSSNMVSELVYGGDVVRDLAEAEWDNYVNALTNDNIEETKTAMKHWIWQVKRKMFGLPVTYHMMLVLYGRQGGGKSTAVTDLCKPIKHFTASTNFANITDSRSHDIWNNYVLKFDEMGHSTTSNLEEIKRIITEDKFTSRVLGSNNDTLIINNATCIGTTNKDISRLIFDDTGMRRFFQINCKDKIDWNISEGINFKRLWKSINENGPTPLNNNIEVLKQITQVQNSKRHITIIEAWLRDRKYENFALEKVNALKFYEEFQEYEKKHSPRAELTNNKFGRDVIDISKNVQGLEITKKRNMRTCQYEIWYVPGRSEE
ncbi:Virulence-associated E [uncultured Caudovirales phage]|uniref:Virulence-associated E n=1 Tax=uncultured Caudovirales phage TaxID=2100421 RepID=A0A6J5L317_9CAUD|nr:Virulence-associated E [uncultured Caudovirales phage]CAB5212532.1 Virulence-associated E [uncultured Caudovirales phage]